MPTFYDKCFDRLAIVSGHVPNFALTLSVFSLNALL